MTYREIATMPTCITPEMWNKTSHNGIHESCLRSYHVAKKVRLLLEQNTQPAIVLELMDLIESQGEFQPIVAFAETDHGDRES